jgi:hypothetical protein
VKDDPNVKVDQDVGMDIKFNNEIGAFVFAKAEPNNTESVNFFNPSNIPALANANNDAEVAKAVATIITAILAKAKEFLLKRIPDLQAASHVELTQTDPTNGTTTLYVDTAEDIGKLCTNVDDTTLRCDSRAISSSAINVAPPPDGQEAPVRPMLVVHMDA